MTLASAGAAAPPKVAKDEVQDATIAKDAGTDEVLVAPSASVAAESKSTASLLLNALVMHDESSTILHYLHFLID